MDTDFDVVVVGSGAAGGTLAADLARSGASVLLLERGARNDGEPREHDERETLINKRPYDDRLISVNRDPARLYMGSGLGGSTSVFGGALLRPAKDDFHPGQFYSSRLPRDVWDWPIDYETLAPFYDKAENLFHVTADGKDNFSPLQPTRCDPQRPPLPLADVNQRLIERTRAAKLNPFRLPLGIESSRCMNCANCAGFVCPTGARRSAGDLVRLAEANGRLHVLCEREVLELDRHQRRTQTVTVRNRTTGAQETYSARYFVMAAGAIGSAAILMRSGFEHAELGRNYMMHYSPLAIGFFAKPTGADRTFVKQVGFADFYFGTREMPEKMGILQSLPAPGPLMLQKSGLRFIPQFVLNRLRRHMLPFVGIVEDLPNRNNRVEVGDATISLHHQFSKYDKQRGESLTRAMSNMLRMSGAVHCVTREMPSREHVAHQCGTIRFGDNPDSAVVDRNCRMFGHDNLFVVDGSILPTSLGVGPSLTLIANALRVSQQIQAEL